MLIIHFILLLYFCLNSVSQSSVQRVHDLLMKDYCTLVKQNQDLNEQLIKFNKSPSSSCEHAEQIATLQQENQTLKDKIDSIANAQNQRPCNSCERNCNSRLKDCEAEIELLKQQLAKKGELIEKLLFPRQKHPSSLRKCGSSESTSCESIESSNSPMHANCLHRSQSDGFASHRSFVSNNLSELEQRDAVKIQALNNGYKELTMILKEKYAQLREQRTKIDELVKELENFADQMEELQCEKEQLENRLKNQPNNVDSLHKMKKQLKKCTTELEQWKQRERILTQKLAAQNDHIATLSAERKSLMQNSDEMKASIRLCKTELRKYND